MPKYKFKFIDLFSGIGGFHQAMVKLGGKCVFASEINEECKNTYQANFKGSKKYLSGDINMVNPIDIPCFDVLCAGFPCQPFSKAGKQEGFSDPTRGNLFYSIMNILDVHTEVKFVILENVRNLADKSENWEKITRELGKRNFYITEDPIILSPSDFGIPQLRERVYILGIRKDISKAEIINNGCIKISDLCLEKHYKKCKIGDYKKILEREVDEKYLISEEQELMITAWDEFRVATKLIVAGFPLWIDYFGLDIISDDDFKEYCDYSNQPEWKKVYITKNRNYYLNNKDFIDSWIEKYDMKNRNKLYRKFEWNCGKDITDMKDAILQIRQSGIRAKRSNYYPSLVAMINTPIIWDDSVGHYRKISTREAANLQSFNKNFTFVGNDNTVYKQLGNSVNVKVIKILGNSLFSLSDKWGIH